MELKEILVEFQNLFTEFVKYIEVSPIDGFPKAFSQTMARPSITACAVLQHSLLEIFNVK
jgi:hypothetical protein